MCHCQESVLHTGLKDYNKTYPSSVLDCKNTLRFQSDVAGFETVMSLADQRAQSLNVSACSECLEFD